ASCATRMRATISPNSARGSRGCDCRCWIERPGRAKWISGDMSLEQKFIETLRALNGSAGNQRLREALGWQEATYGRIKSALIEAGKIVPGRGRGGTVALAGRRAKALAKAGRTAKAKPAKAAAKPKATQPRRAKSKPAKVKSDAAPAASLRRGGPVRKSDLYASLWASCDELRGGMDASQYKDYVLTLLFVKYVSDKYAGKRYAPV